VPSKAVIQSTIENLAGAVNNNPAPVYLIFVDHGNTDGADSEFLLGDESLSPAEVDQWLDTFEAALNPLAAAEARIIITGACYSGGFIPLLSGNHRVVITSAAADEVSYKGPLESDQIRVGEYFLEEFFQGLDRGESLANAFVVATDKTETYTRESDAANSANVYLDSAVQHPLLDDNGDGIGANVLQAGADEDGVLASGLYLGTGPAFNTNSVDNPADVSAVSPTQFLGAAQNAATLRLTANDNAQVAQAIIEVRAPDAVLAGGVLESGGTPVTEQQAADSYDRRLLNAPGTQGCAANQFCLDYDGFITPGRYEIFYYVEDVETGALSPGERSVVYKTTGANQSPAAFNLSQPANGATVHTVSGFSWQASGDPDGDAVTYTLRVCTDPALSIDCVVQEEIDATITVVTEGLSDLTTYYWQVQAVDVFGAVTASSNVFSFDTDDGNSVLGVIKGFVQSSRDLALLTSHLVTRTNNGIPLEFVNAETDEGGQYILVTLAGQAQLQVTALGFESSSASVVVPEPVIDPNTFKSTVQTVRRDFILAEEPPPATDSDGDGLSDDDEVNVYGTQPGVADSDDDGLSDGAEVLVHGTNPNDADTDDDGLTDGAEVLQYGSDPGAADSDHDGVDDGAEVTAGRSPTVNEPAILLRIIDFIID
ncbi:MAG: hypothetical protein H6978_15700, partial [Gammaproteobacteria bacterium]|nr:hypothetical protein [Gammaproteobacteria bacterium]